MATSHEPLSRPRRPRHDAADSEREILRAAEELIGETPFREVTVQRIMLRTGLARPAFYVHFRDLGDLLLRVAERIRIDFEQASAKWLAAPGGTEDDLRDAIEQAIGVYARNAALLRALADAAPADERAEAAYFGIVEALAAEVGQRVRGEQQAGRITPRLDAEQISRALVWMNERFLYHSFSAAGVADVRSVTQTLGQIWLATLYERATPHPLG